MKKLSKYVGKTAACLMFAVMALAGVTGCAAKLNAADSMMAAASTTAAAGAEAGAANIAEVAVASEFERVYENSSMMENYANVYAEDYFNTEEYKAIVESGFKSVADHPLSTFSADVDTASYSNVRRLLENHEGVPEDAVRIEEMINYFHFNYPEPEGEDPLSITTELSNCPWNPDSELMLVGLKAREIDFDNRPMSNLVFLLDVSGSMYDENKLPLVQKSFAMLTEELTEQDRVSIVTYAGYETVLLKGVTGDRKDEINDALMSLTAGGSTAGGAGIKKAYDLARKYYIEGGNNRVILATDGDLNVGVTSEGELTSLIKKERESGVHLSVLGFGAGNIKDNKMVALADNGDGNYRYIDSLLEAKKVLVEEMGGTLITVAKDVKLQVEFNPAQVKGYRLIGYEKRELKDEDFNNDSVDAGEIGSGHNVTALYEILPVDSSQEVGNTDLKYQEKEQTEKTASALSEELLTVNIRYKAPNGNKSKLITHPVGKDIFTKNMPDNLRFAAAVSEFGMLLRDSEWKGTSSYGTVLELASGPVIDDEYKEGFVKLVRMAEKK